MRKTHGVTHWDPDGCFGCKIATVGVAPSAMPSRHPGAARTKRKDAALVKDLAAYKGMRQEGLNPKQIDGAARVRSECESEFEVNSGQPAHKMAKGPDAGKPVSQRGKEWRRRATEAHDAVKTGDIVVST